jgi:hypothetical protein
LERFVIEKHEISIKGSQQRISINARRRGNNAITSDVSRDRDRNRSAGGYGFHG